MAVGGFALYEPPPQAWRGAAPPRRAVFNSPDHRTKWVRFVLGKERAMISPRLGCQKTRSPRSSSSGDMCRGLGRM